MGKPVTFIRNRNGTRNGSNGNRNGSNGNRNGSRNDKQTAGQISQQDIKNYITPHGYARLKTELTRLLDVERPELVKVIAWAASNGDRSENGDYIYGKKRLREIDRRIHQLSARLDIAQVVDPAARGESDRIH